MTYRTAPLDAIRKSSISRVNYAPAQNITHHVTIPGLRNPDGSPVVVEKTFTVHEVAEDWASFIVDFEFGSDPVVYGNHPCAVGPLREVLPASYELPDYPANVYEARFKLRTMLCRHRLEGDLIVADADGQTLEYHFPDGDVHRASVAATIREYIPFQADVWYDEANDVVRVRPARNEVSHIVRTA